MKKSRNTVSTRRRQDNTRKLISELAKREMMADEICFFFGYSPSGVRKYIRALREAGVIELAGYAEGTAAYLGKAVYRLTPDADRISAFLELLDHGDTPQTTARVGNSRIKHPPGSGRLHIMDDDTYYRIKPEPVVCRRDELVAALFGAAGVQA